MTSLETAAIPMHSERKKYWPTITLFPRTLVRKPEVSLQQGFCLSKSTSPFTKFRQHSLSMSNFMLMTTTFKMREKADQRTKKWRIKVEDKGVRILIIMCDMLVIITLKKYILKTRKILKIQ